MAGSQRGSRPDGLLVDKGPLKRAISRNMLLVIVVGDVLGAGIYALVGEVGGRVGGAIWGAFLLALALAMLTASAYAELVTKVSEGGGSGPLREPRLAQPLCNVPRRLRRRLPGGLPRRADHAR
jgi:hypothetical protein